MNDFIRLANEMSRTTYNNPPGQGVPSCVIDEWAERLRCIIGATKVAYLHSVVSDDGEPDYALSFYADSFPLEGCCGYRSLGSVPLYAVPSSA